MKQCCRCNETKPLEQYSNNKRNPDGKYRYCKTCQKEGNARYFQENKERFYAHNKAKRLRNSQRLLEYKSTLSCSICGENRHWCLDFHHHNDDKDKAVSDMIGTHAWASIIEEINKCIVVCRNCHADIHYHEKQHHFTL